MTSRRSAFEIGVEMRADMTHERPAAIGQLKAVVCGFDVAWLKSDWLTLLLLYQFGDVFLGQSVLDREAPYLIGIGMGNGFEESSDALACLDS